jgi:cell division protein YceG involved in septum cleavage
MRAAFVVLLLLTGLGSARADVHPSKAGKVSVDIPKKWSVVNATDELVRAASPDNAVAFVLWVVESADTKEALKKLEGELYSSIQGLRWVDKTKQLKVHGLPATWVEGAGVNAAAAQLDVLVVVAGPTSTKKGVIMLAVVEHEKLVGNKKTIESIFKSLKPTK